MSFPARYVGWLCLVVWFAWIHALQERMSVDDTFALATPDLGMVLFVGLLGLVRKGDVFFLALVAAVGRKSFSVDPSLAILCGFLGLAWLASLLREIVELSSPLWRALLVVLGACGLSFWLELVRYANVGSALPQIDNLLPLAFTSGLAALALGGVFIRLPGLTALRAKE
ncbi:MAG: hypothetical protein ACI8X5_000080 [Planctomycetota bacterium]|jgi:hypothetical protein